MEDENLETNPLLHSTHSNDRKKTKSNILRLFYVAILFAAIIVPFVVFVSPNASQQATYQVGASPNDTTELSQTTTEEPVDTTIQVDVAEGTLQGKRFISRNGREYLAFLGIPYAKPPVGELRFKLPVEPEPWDGVRDATKNQLVCIQKRSSNKAPHGSEDCLYLNVFTPKAVADLGRRRNLLPVILYVHGGGGGAEGDGSRYSGEYFMDEDIILVTIDYRLGVLGSLNLNISDAAGNQGLKDQVMGLKWVQNNIRKFGGDKNKVTLFGNSAGAHQVSTHLISPMSKSLFRSAIVQSGTTILPGYFSGDPVQDGIDLGIKLNCTTTNETLISDLLECFQNTSAADLVLQSIHLRHWFTFTYSVDTAAEPADQIFLPDLPLVLLQNGNISKIPLMIGCTSAEGLPQALQILIEPRRAEGYNQVPWTNNSIVIDDLQLQLSTTLEQGGIIAEDARNFYFGNGTRNVSIDNAYDLEHMMSDRLFLHPIFTTARKQFDVNNSTASNTSGRGRGGGGGRGNRGRSQNSQNGVYMYIFTHKLEVSRCQGDRFHVEILSTENFGVCHADELQFFFPNGGKGGIYPEIPLGHPFANFSQMVVKFWATFATNGVPTGAMNNATWLPIDGTKPFQAFDLNEEPKMVDYYPERIEFWEKYNLDDLYR